MDFVCARLPISARFDWLDPARLPTPQVDRVARRERIDMPQSDTSSSTGAISSSGTSAVAPVSGVPGAIYIIRHGEKPPDDDHPSARAVGSEQIFGVDVDGNQNPDSLIPRGWQRAGGLAQFLSPSDGVFATSLLARPSVI